VETLIGTGTAEVGIFVVPWVPLVLWAALIGGIALALRVRRGAGTPTARGMVAALRRRATWFGPVRMPARLLLFALWWVPVVSTLLLGRWDPLSAAEPFAPGPSVAEVRADGQWQDDSIEHAMSWSWSPGEPCLTECSGPRYIFRLNPGERFAVVVTVRNDGPLPITLLGRESFDGASRSFGLALLRNPDLPADAPNLLPFQPVELPPGGSVSVAMIKTAESCAKAQADVDRGDTGATGYPFVYELLGWRRVGYVWPHFAVTVAGCE
jgi:hypothetical protein